jgi:hypothetical protein
VYLVGLAVFVFSALEKLSDFFGGKADAGVVTEVKDIQADIFFTIFKFRQFHILILPVDYTDCTDFFTLDFSFDATVLGGIDGLGEP